MITTIRRLGNSRGIIIPKPMLKQAGLDEEAEIGTLAVGSRADVTVLEERIEDWPMRDGQAEVLRVERRWIPRLVLRAGQPVVPTLRLVRDVIAPDA